MSAGLQDDLNTVERLLFEARKIALESNSAPEAAQGPLAASKLARLLIQEGREMEAEPLLVEHGFSHRLSTQVLCGGHMIDKDKAGAVARQRGRERDDLLAVVDDVLPAGMLDHLQRLFDADSLFWREHEYHRKSTGYFSYTHALDTPPQSNLDQILHYLWRLAITKFPVIGNCKLKQEQSTRHAGISSALTLGTSAGGCPRNACGVVGT
jgi:hypothetical protein